MILRILHPGSPSKGPLLQAARGYQKRLRDFRVDERFLKSEKITERGDRAIQSALAKEGERILQALGPHDHLVVLDRQGSAVSSEKMADDLQRWMNQGKKAVCFALGSAWGLSDEVKKKAHARWSFGAITLPHDLACVVLWEQLYRAQTILRKEPYHK